MADTISKTHRSWLMAQIRGKHTKPERIARSLLHRLGYRFTVNGPKNKRLPGRPDIVLPRYQTAIFVHGCFWHRHAGCRLATTPQSNTDYWTAKFERNVARDAENLAALRQAGWQVITLWECELKAPDAVAARLIAALPRSTPIELPEERDDELLVAETQSTYGKARRADTRTKPKRR